MAKFLTSVWKETLILSRDRGGLALLFIMPTALVLIVTLIQEGAFKTVKGGTVPLLVLNRDRGDFGRDLEAALEQSGYFDIRHEYGPSPLTEDGIREAVSRGKVKVGVVIPPEATEQLRRGIDRLTGFGGLMETAAGEQRTITVYLDPVIPDTYRKTVTSSLFRLSQGLETRMLFAKLAGMLGRAPAAGNWEPGRTVPIREVYAGSHLLETMPTSVQQNVPAWTLFAMFLIVIPLAGSIIKERSEGTMVRLRTLPVPAATILSGKIVGYVGICLVQFGLMVTMGIYLMPLLGTPKLEIGSNWAAITAAALASALAATGMGIMVGALARTNDQATVFGSTFVVIAAALGGIMVPVFLMPPGMQPIAAYSPLNWGLSAFLDIFVRRAGLTAILPHLARLLGFFAVTLSVAALSFIRRD